MAARFAAPLIVLFAFILASCGGDKSTPTSATPPTSTTSTTSTTTTSIPPAPQTFTVAGVLRDRSSNQPLVGGTVRVQAGLGLNNSSSTDGNGYYSIAGVNGAIVLAFSAPGHDPLSQTVNINNADTRFDFSLTATAPPPAPFSRSGTGDNVFTIPSSVTRIQIDANYPGSCQNFVVRIAGRLIVNEILGTCSVASGRSFTGTYLTSGGIAEVTNSTGVNWLFTQR